MTENPTPVSPEISSKKSLSSLRGRNARIMATAVLATGLAIGAFGTEQTAPEIQPPSSPEPTLFIPTLIPSQAESRAVGPLEAPRPDVTETRVESTVIINSEALTNTKKLKINLPDGSDFSAQLNPGFQILDFAVYQSTEENGNQITIVERDGTYSGTIVTAEGKTFAVKYTGTNEIHTITELDFSQLSNGGDEGNDAVPVPVPAPPTPAELPTSTEDGSVIEIAIDYTPAASAADSNIQATIAAGIARANQGLAPAGTQLRMTRIPQEVAHVERATTYEDLEAARALSQTRRGSADLYQLITEKNAQSSSCGQGYQMSKEFRGPQFADWAISVVRRECIPHDSMFHEAGHGLGMQHNPENTNTPGAYDFSFGAQSPRYRDVMSYACTDRECARLPILSGPNTIWNGERIGSATQDNRRTVTETRLWAANFRLSTTPQTQTKKTYLPIIKKN